MAKKKRKINKRKATRRKEKSGLINYIKKDNKKLNWFVFISCLVVVFIVAAIGSMFTDTGAWYESIKPSISPPNYVFPIVWTILFYFIAVSLYYSWLALNKKKVMIYYGINFILNILWSYLFFTMKNPSFAFIDIIVLWFSIMFLIVFSWKKSETASYLLIPYLLWVSFATILNYLIIA